MKIINRTDRTLEIEVNNETSQTVWELALSPGSEGSKDLGAGSFVPYGYPRGFDRENYLFDEKPRNVSDDTVISVGDVYPTFQSLRQSEKGQGE